MRKIDLRVPAVAGLAILLLAFAPRAEAAESDIVFVEGTGAASAVLPDNEASKAAAQINDVAEDLADPQVQDGVAAIVERVGETLLDMPVGKFAAAIERARPGTVDRHIREDATLADLAGSDAARLPRELGQGSRQMLTMLSGFAAAFAAMAPELEDMARDIDAQVKDIRRSRN